MKKPHLRIQTGINDKFELISKTIEVSADYFETIRILNLGPKENSLKYVVLLQKYKHLEVVDFAEHYTLCVTSDILRHHCHDIPDGEWGCWMDSDWRFPQSSLDMIQTELEIAETEDVNCLYSCQFGHSTEPFDHHLFIDTGKTTEENNECIQRGINHFISNPESYGFPLFQKINKKSMWFDSWFENHGYALQTPYKKKLLPTMYHLHIRSFLDKDYCNSMTYQCWWYLGHHIFNNEEQYTIINSHEYKSLEAFKLKYQCFTSNMFDIMLNTDPIFKKELTELFLTFKESAIVSCQQMYKMASKYNMEFIKNPPIPECKANCCTYKTY